MKKPTVLGISRSGGARNPHVFQYTLRFLRSGGTRPSFAHDGFSQTLSQRLFYYGALLLLRLSLDLLVNARTYCLRINRRQLIKRFLAAASLLMYSIHSLVNGYFELQSMRTKILPFRCYVVKDDVFI
ncbi:MAG: hypothetical protein ACREYE_02020 [Gammaproteobacteria bacterium]